MTSFFRKQTFGETEQKLALAANSKLVQQCFDPKYACARTKTEAIICNVLAPWAAEQLKQDLSSANYVSVYADASNYKSTKLFPILVHYFKPDSEIQVKMLEMKELPGETSDIISAYLMEATNGHDEGKADCNVCSQYKQQLWRSGKERSTKRLPTSD